jgi:hypothetical protein
MSELDLSSAHRIQFDIDGTKARPQQAATPQVSLFGRFDITGLWTPNFVGPVFAQPGTNIFTINMTNLDAVLWVVTASATEVLPADGTPHAGDALYRTWSVQLDQHGNFIRIAFDVFWTSPLASGVMIWLGVT